MGQKFSPVIISFLNVIILPEDVPLQGEKQPGSVHPWRQPELRRAHQLRESGLQHDLPPIPVQHSVSLNEAGNKESIGHFFQ